MAGQKRQSVVQPLLLTVPDVAIQLGVCRATVYNLMAYNSLPYIIIRGVRRVHPDSLREWLRRCEQVA
jgi:excisionase family DNA binding protein